MIIIISTLIILKIVMIIMINDSLAGVDGNSKSYLDDNYTIEEYRNVQAVISNQRQEGVVIGLQLNMQKEIIKLGRT